MAAEADDGIGVLYPEDSSELATPIDKTKETESGPRIRCVVAAISAALSYLIVPYLILYYFTQLMPILTVHSSVSLTIILIGIPIVIVAAYTGYVYLDDKRRSISHLAQTVLTIVYLFGVLGLGPVQITAGVLVLTLDITGFFYLLLFGTILHGLSPAWDLVQNRGKY